METAQEDPRKQQIKDPRQRPLPFLPPLTPPSSSHLPTAKSSSHPRSGGGGGSDGDARDTNAGHPISEAVAAGPDTPAVKAVAAMMIQSPW